MKTKKMKILSWAAIALVAAGTSITIGAAWKSETKQGEAIQKPIAQNESVETNPNPPTDFRIKPEEGISHAFGTGKIERQKLKPYELKLLPQFQAVEDSKYSIEAVNEQVKKALKGLNLSYLPYTTDFMNAVYNLVQAYDEANEEQIVAWRTPQQLLAQGTPEYAILYLEGGPFSEVVASRMIAMSRTQYARTFIINEAQFGILPRQMVGKHGARAQGNYYMDRLRGSDKSFLKRYKELYDKGELGDGALFWALAGNLDLNLLRLFAASSLAADIVASARLFALTKQLLATNYKRVTLAGFSYGFMLGLQSLLINPQLIQLLYKIELGFDVVTDWFDPETLTGWTFTFFNPRLSWTRWLFDFGDLYNTTQWISSVINNADSQEIGNDFRSKTTIYNAKNDDVIERRDADGKLTEKWKDNKNFWEETLRVPYHLFDSGGHTAWWNTADTIPNSVGLNSSELIYKMAVMDWNLIMVQENLMQQQIQAIIPKRLRLST